MNHLLRIEFPGAACHVTSRGERCEEICTCDGGRSLFLGVLTQAAERLHSKVLAYHLMGNHYHWVLQTRDTKLSMFMGHRTGVYTQAFNRRHSLTAHLSQGRFHTNAEISEECRGQNCRAALNSTNVESGISMSELARELKLSVGRISQLIKRAEAFKKENSRCELENQR